MALKWATRAEEGSQVSSIFTTTTLSFSSSSAMVSMRVSTSSSGVKRATAHRGVFRRQLSMSNACAQLVTVRNGRRECTRRSSVYSSSDASLPVLLLGLHRPITIGRNPQLWCVFLFNADASTLIAAHPATTLSKMCPSRAFTAKYPRASAHRRVWIASDSPFYRVRSPNGGIIVSCMVRALLILYEHWLTDSQDYSKNGVILNEYRMRKTSVILMNGDQLRIPDSLSESCLSRSCVPLASDTTSSVYMRPLDEGAPRKADRVRFKSAARAHP